MLKFPPIKINKFPKYAVYKNQKTHSTYFNIASLKTGKFVGQMVTSTSNYRKALYIEKLIVLRRNRGIGTILINLAKKESKKKFCNGDIYCLSSTVYDKENPPYLFYKKLGFEPEECDEWIDKYLNKCIENHTQVDPEILNEDLFMYRKNI